MLRISFSHQQHNRGSVGRTVLWQALLPVGRKQARVVRNSVYVIGQAQSNNVGLQTIDDRTGLLARTAMGLLNRHSLPRLRLPVSDESLVELLIQLPRRVVRHIQQGYLARLRHGRD